MKLSVLVSALASRVPVLRIVVLVSTLPFLIATPRTCAAAAWHLELGVGQAVDYTYRTLQFSSGDAPQIVHASGRAWAGLGRTLSGGLSVWSEGGYVGYEQEGNVALSNGGGTRTILIGSSLNARVLSLGLGLRYSLGSAPSPKPAPYVQFLPAAFLSTWRETRRYRSTSSPDVWRVDDSFTKAAPGFETGAGMIGPFIGPTRVDLGFRYRWSADLGSHALGMNGGTFDGLRQFEFAAGLRF